MIPRFESGFLAEVAEAFRKRRKSLVHRNAAPELYKTYDRNESSSIERLEIYLEHGAGGQIILNLHAWPDRFLWLYARRLSKAGTVWSWEYDGRLLGNNTGQDTISALEETYSLLYRLEGGNTDSLTSPWKARLARGPREV